MGARFLGGELELLFQLLSKWCFSFRCSGSLEIVLSEQEQFSFLKIPGRDSEEELPPLSFFLSLRSAFSKADKLDSSHEPPVGSQKRETHGA